MIFMNFVLVRYKLWMYYIVCLALHGRYYSLTEIADHFFPPRERLGVYDSHYSTVRYWRDPLPKVLDQEISIVEVGKKEEKWQLPAIDKQSVSAPVDVPRATPPRKSILQSNNSYDLLETFSESDSDEERKLKLALEPRREFQKTGKYWIMPFSLYM